MTIHYITMYDKKLFFFSRSFTDLLLWKCVFKVTLFFFVFNFIVTLQNKFLWNILNCIMKMIVFRIILYTYPNQIHIVYCFSFDLGQVVSLILILFLSTRKYPVYQINVVGDVDFSLSCWFFFHSTVGIQIKNWRKIWKH